MSIAEVSPAQAEVKRQTAIDLVIPVFNEMECLDELAARLGRLREAHADLDIYVILVNDGSVDGSGDKMDRLALEHRWIYPVHLVRNFGHQAAVTAGLDASSSEYVAVIDADLQDPPELIPQMLAQLIDNDLHVVYGTRSKRTGDSWFKRRTAQGFYRILQVLSGLDIPHDTGDFRVMTRMVAESLRRLPEHNRFMRALIPWLGYSSAPFYYDRQERFAGHTKYPLRKMIALASHAIFSFSTFPIRAVQGTALLLLVLGGLVGTGCAGATLLSTNGASFAWWIASAMFLQTGLLMLAIGMVGGYVFRIQHEVVGRPVYVRKGVNIGERRSGLDRRKGSSGRDS